MDLSSYSMVEISVGMVFTGLVVVFLALVGLWLIVAIFGKIFTAKAAGASKGTNAPPPSAPSTPTVQKAAAPPPKPNVMPIVQSGISGDVVAAIAGAVAALTDGQGVVESISRSQPAGAAAVTLRSAWAQAGVIQNTQPF